MEVSWKGATPNHPKLALKAMFLGSPHVKQSSQCCVTGPKLLNQIVSGRAGREDVPMQQKNGPVLASSGRKNKEHVIYYIYNMCVCVRLKIGHTMVYHNYDISPNDPKWPFKGEEEDYHPYWKLGCHILVENKSLGGTSNYSSLLLIIYRLLMVTLHQVIPAPNGGYTAPSHWTVLAPTFHLAASFSLAFCSSLRMLKAMKGSTQRKLSCIQIAVVHGCSPPNRW